MMRATGSVLIGLLTLALPALAQQPRPESEDQPERVVRRSTYSYYGPYYVLDGDGEPTGEVREGGRFGAQDETYGFGDGWGGWDRGGSGYGYSGRSWRARWRWSAEDGRWVRNVRGRTGGQAPRPAPSRP